MSPTLKALMLVPACLLLVPVVYCYRHEMWIETGAMVLGFALAVRLAIREWCK